MNKLARAAAFATECHKFQKRKYSSSPYIHHPYRVMGHLLSHYNGVTEEELAAAVLHDVIEDCYAIDLRADPSTISGFEAACKDILAITCEKTLSIVVELTHLQCIDNKVALLNRAGRKEADKARLMSSSVEARRIKVCDIYDNTIDSPISDSFIKNKWIPEAKELMLCIGDSLPSVRDKFNALVYN